MKKGEGRITEKTSGNRGYTSTWLYIPSDISKDREFPFRDREKVVIELKDNKLIVRKSHKISDITKRYGFPDATLPDLVENRASQNGDSPFLYFQDEIFSFQATNRISNQIANGLIAFLENLSLDNPNIALFFPDCPEIIFTWIGVSKTKSPLVPISYTLKGDLLKYVLKNSNTEILILDYQYFDEFTNIEPDLPKIKKVLIRNAPESFEFNQKYLNFEDILSDNKKNPDIEVKNSDPLEIMYTAGTTGKPKGVLYRHYYSLSGVSVGSKLKKLGFEEATHKIYCPLPLFQAFAKYFVLIPALFYNSSVVIANPSKVEEFWNDISDYEPQGFCYHGAFFLDLMNQEPRISDRQHSLEYAFGFGALKKGWEAFERRFGIQIIEAWALREGIGFTINHIGSKGGKIGSVGIPAKGYEVKIVDSDGNELPPGRNNIGEIVSRTKLSIELEYYNLEVDPDTTIGDKRWVYTGDYGYRDSDGFIYFLGRKSDKIERGNETFFASDIEQVANSHPLILNSALIKVKDENSSDEVLKLWATVKDKASIEYSDFHSYLKENLAYFMVPRFIEFKNELPKNANQLVQKFILKKEWEEEEAKGETYDTKQKKILE